jgi:hypothetical protein
VQVSGSQVLIHLGTTLGQESELGAGLEVGLVPAGEVLLAAPAGAVLAGAVLAGAVLAGAVLAGAVLAAPGTPVSVAVTGQMVVETAMV